MDDETEDGWRGGGFIAVRGMIKGFVSRPTRCLYEYVPNTWKASIKPLPSIKAPAIRDQVEVYLGLEKGKSPLRSQDRGPGESTFPVWWRRKWLQHERA